MSETSVVLIERTSTSLIDSLAMLMNDCFTRPCEFSLMRWNTTIVS